MPIAVAGCQSRAKTPPTGTAWRATVETNRPARAISTARSPRDAGVRHERREQAGGRGAAEERAHNPAGHARLHLPHDDSRIPLHDANDFGPVLRVSHDRAPGLGVRTEDADARAALNLPLRERARGKI